VKHEAVKVDSDAFEWTQLRGWAFSALLTRIGQRTDLDQLYELLKATDFELPLMGKAHLARDMEAAERASIVGIDRLGKTRSYYYLTPHGRDWLLDKMQANKRTSTSEQM
jgi:hypothetical protein